MTCKYFGLCASCTLYNKTYEEQLNYKIAREKLNLKTLRPDAIAVKQNIQTQLDDAKKQLKDIYEDDFDEKADDQTML